MASYTFSSSFNITIYNIPVYNWIKYDIFRLLILFFINFFFFCLINIILFYFIFSLIFYLYIFIESNSLLFLFDNFDIILKYLNENYMKFGLSSALGVSYHTYTFAKWGLGLKKV